MEHDPYIFRKYYGNPQITMRHDPDYGSPGLYGYGYGMAARMPRIGVKLEVDFQDDYGYKSLLKDLYYVDSLQDEERLRGRIPELQRAWEEYQILLRLYR